VINKTYDVEIESSCVPLVCNQVNERLLIKGFILLRVFENVNQIQICVMVKLYTIRLLDEGACSWKQIQCILDFEDFAAVKT
jgi:hypothetical protein